MLSPKSSTKHWGGGNSASSAGGGYSFEKQAEDSEMRIVGGRNRGRIFGIRLQAALAASTSVTIFVLYSPTLNASVPTVGKLCASARTGSAGCGCADRLLSSPAGFGLPCLYKTPNLKKKNTNFALATLSCASLRYASPATHLHGMCDAILYVITPYPHCCDHSLSRFGHCVGQSKSTSRSPASAFHCCVLCTPCDRR